MKDGARSWGQSRLAPSTRRGLREATPSRRPFPVASSFGPLRLRAVLDHLRDLARRGPVRDVERAPQARPGLAIPAVGTRVVEVVDRPAATHAHEVAIREIELMIREHPVVVLALVAL